jgi:light-regulated signal transduction histidine kinase (bacteriophytochrome)
MTQDMIDKATEFSRDFEVNPKLAENVPVAELLNKTIDFLNEEVRETTEAIAAVDLPEVIDGFGDVAFVALNGIYKTFRFQGATHEQAKVAVVEVMDRICTANLGKKQADGTIKYVNGKVVKPEGWTPPTYSDMVA